MGPGSERRRTGSRDDDGRALHLRLLGRDPTAPTDLADQYLPLLLDWLRRTFHEDDALLTEVAIELILSLGERPEQYDPNRRPLPTYLRMAARWDLKNALARESRRTAHLVPLDIDDDPPSDVEVRPRARNREWARTPDPADTVVDALYREKVLAMREYFDERDWEVVELQMDGERRTERYASVLGLQDRPRDEQVRAVKRAKDRIKKRLQRLWRTMIVTDDD